MRSLNEWFVRNKVAANLVVAIILVAGVLASFTLRQEIFPEFSADQITISVEYPGAAPEDVENAICLRIEEAIQGLDGVKRMTSTATEGAGAVVVEALPGADSRRLLDDIKARIDAIDTFPEETEKPVIREIVVRNQVINIGISGQADEKTLRHVGERVRDEVSSIPGITQAELVSVRPYEIAIELSESAMRQYGLTFDEVARAVRRSSLDLPGGSIKTDAGEVLLRIHGQAYTDVDFSRVILRTFPGGGRLTIGDVATVRDGFEDSDQRATLDGAPAVMVQIFRVGDQNAISIAKKVHAYIDNANRWAPNGIKIVAWQDYAKYLEGRINLLRNDTFLGFLLVFLVLALFLKFRLAFWVSFGIPIAFLGALALMPILDVSISMISLFAFIIVLGIVVDDAIIIGENIYSKYQEGLDGISAAIKGTQEVMTPVTYGVLTTVAAFVPMLFIGGNTGKVMRVIPLIVIPTLLVSLLEGLLFLPAHLRDLDKHPAKTTGFAARWSRIQQWFAGGLDRFVVRVYRPLLDRVIRWRYVSVAIAAAFFIFTVGVVGGGRIQFTFFPHVEADDIAVAVTMPLGAPIEATAAAVAQLERAAEQLRAEIDAKGGVEGGGSIIRHILSSVGEQPYRTAQTQGPHGAGRSFRGSHLGEVHLEVAAAETRSVSGNELVQRWRDLAGPIPSAVEVSFSSSVFSPGEAINIQLVGRNLEDLRAAAAELRGELEKYPGAYGVTDSFRAGKGEIKLAIKPEAESLGLTLQDLARQVRQGFYGEEAQSIQRGRDEVKVMVRYAEDERRTLSALEGMRIRTPDGAEVPFSTVATAQIGRGFSSIKRVDRQRAVNVTAAVDEGKGNANEIAADLGTKLPGILAGYPGVQHTFEGERREQHETLVNLMSGFVVTLFVIYALLAIPFGSYSQPFIVMTAIPFGIIGAIWGHVIMGMNLTILSMFGVVALAGMVVNDSLVLVDFINQGRKSGMSVIDAVRNAGTARFRAIALISSTTFLGLAPLILERSVQAQFLVPMAVSLGFGVIFSTGISLLLVPTLYLILEDLKARLRGERLDSPAMPRGSSPQTS